MKVIQMRMMQVLPSVSKRVMMPLIRGDNRNLRNGIMIEMLMVAGANGSTVLGLRLRAVVPFEVRAVRGALLALEIRVEAGTKVVADTVPRVVIEVKIGPNARLVRVVRPLSDNSHLFSKSQGCARMLQDV